MTATSTPKPEIYEKLGAFYLGREYDLRAKELRESLLMYDSRDLTTHALCVGMTGSGKTGLCIALLEEAAMDGVPAIALDPKGDLSNLLLTFPNLSPNDFFPWIDPAEATRKGCTVEELASNRAQQWREGLAEWGQAPERIAKLRETVDLAIYTPGSNAGIPLTVLKSFDAPPASVANDHELMASHVSSAASGLLALLGIDADPLSSREHVLLSSILQHAWSTGQSIPLGDLIGAIHAPPFDRVGVLPVESFMPAADRSKLAMRLNNLLASPAFAPWLIGEPLDIKRLLYSPSGKPKLSIVSIAHLSDGERMFFVTRLLSELSAWMRGQKGTSSLRAIFYMDEIAGYFPPVANPPSKAPMLTLLKQARAFGLGITVATQNPVDLDYKGLANIGTWFLGRLQTERDKQRVLEGLEGAATQAGHGFNRSEMEQTLAGLGNRVFLLHNVHEDHPRVFQSRWVMSYLAGPLAREQITQLKASQEPEQSQAESTASAAVAPVNKPAAVATTPSRPVIPTTIRQRFVASHGYRDTSKQTTHYMPGLYVAAQLHFVRAASNFDHWQDVALWLPCPDTVPTELWETAEVVQDWVWQDEADANSCFTEPPTELLLPANYKRWTSAAKDHLFRTQKFKLYFSPQTKATATGGLTESEARLELSQQAREARDEAIEELRAKYAKLDAALTKKLQLAMERVDREKNQYNHATLSTVIELGSSLLGGLFGNKRSRLTASKGASAARSVGRASQQRGDVQAAEAALEELRQQVLDLNEQATQEAEALRNKFDPQNLALEVIEVSPKKTDLKVDTVCLAWLPG